MHLAKGVFVLPAFLAGLAGCSGADHLTAPRPLAPRAPAFETYEDSATYVESGGSLAGGFSGSVSGAFYNSNANFTATAPIWWQWVTDVSATVTATVANNADNSTVNSASSSGGRSGWVPNFSRVDTTLQAQASTLNRVCGVTGHSHLSGSAALHLLVNSSVTTPWQTSLNTDGADVTLPDCAPEEGTQSQPSPCPGQIIYDPSSCNQESGGSDGSGYDPSDGCTYYLITPVISYDGGNTWYQNGDPYIEQVC